MHGKPLKNPDTAATRFQIPHSTISQLGDWNWNWGIGIRRRVIFARVRVCGITYCFYSCSPYLLLAFVII